MSEDECLFDWNVPAEWLSHRDAPAEGGGMTQHESPEWLSHRDAPAEVGGMAQHGLPERLSSRDAPANSGGVRRWRQPWNWERRSDAGAGSSDNVRPVTGGDAGAASGGNAELGGRKVDQDDSHECLSVRDGPAKRSRSPFTESYAVRRPMVDDILLRLNVDKPSVDGFADSQLHVIDRWWGPESAVPDARA